MKEVEKPVTWGRPLMHWWEQNLSFNALDTCEHAECQRARADGTFCAVHSPIFQEMDTQEWEDTRKGWEQWKKQKS